MTAGPDQAAIDELVGAARAGRPRAVARLISAVENDSPALRPLMAALAPYTGRAHVIGITGAPGVGKSTITGALVAAYRTREWRVGVLAIDPSSPFTGGALLGDRVRMQQHALDGEVFIRSMASRGHLGGLSVATPQALRVFDAAGCDVVLVETVGVGQSEVEIAANADSTLVLLAPGMGDGIQAAKAGVLEIGDVFVVNKADRDGVQSLIREIRTMIAMAERDPARWKPPITKTVAASGDGIDELVAEIDKHRAHAEGDGSWQQRRLHRAAAEVESLAMAYLRRRVRFHRGDELQDLALSVRDGKLDAYTAADQVLTSLREGARPTTQPSGS
ncbi:methylmalonyl Co-A mutase-associated GTPase MeaB [Microlunatus elymi]|uniref:Methylmalonyl Co-A mutase-associated GTPase MeaB n=1 Tax=Microlunatus elymi TaxID=2596828 RepID=A0A516Q0R9_9ACTN|nr:methylmalonyl Co-A mutase-associated GTPase MeaB [Microlunatus elymi]QDP97033.1 methylmalonyl Co-A mutase-associated GTPase MeaB [Microlunatus elymi]